MRPTKFYKPTELFDVDTESELLLTATLDIALRTAMEFKKSANAKMYAIDDSAQGITFDDIIAMSALRVHAMNNNIMYW